MYVQMTVSVFLHVMLLWFGVAVADRGGRFLEAALSVSPFFFLGQLFLWNPLIVGGFLPSIYWVGWSPSGLDVRVFERSCVLRVGEAVEVTRYPGFPALVRTKSGARTVLSMHLLRLVASRAP